jgi:hypothetical protein
MLDFKRANATDCFIFSAYASELWALRNLQAYKRPDDLFRTREVNLLHQIAEEEDHVHLLKGLLPNELSLFGEDEVLPYAMQEILYKGAGGIDLFKYSNPNADPELFMLFHEIAELRAIWNYKCYILFGRSGALKEVLKKIIQDEVGHVTKYQHDNPFTSKENKLFQIHLKEAYGNTVNNMRFWRDYFTKQVVRMENGSGSN